MFASKISGIGHYVPDRVVTNKDLESIMDTSDDWIVERTGIHERRWIDPATGDTPSTMGTKAALKAIENIEKGTVVVIICDRGDRYLSSTLFDK